MAGARYVLAIDQGTTSTRAIAVRSGRPAAARPASASSTSTIRSPAGSSTIPSRSGATRSRPAADALEQAGRSAAEIAAIGITNQRETVVLWERASGRPVHPAIVWQDRRTAARCRELQDAGHDPLVQARTGLLIDPYFSATKLAWLLDEVAGARAPPSAASSPSAPSTASCSGA